MGDTKQVLSLTEELVSDLFSSSLSYLFTSSLSYRISLLLKAADDDDDDEEDDEDIYLELEVVDTYVSLVHCFGRVEIWYVCGLLRQTYYGSFEKGFTFKSIAEYSLKQWL
jgi:hypothetical protein